MANNLNHALPKPFQSTTTPQIVSSTTKATQNDTNYFHGYRSNFDINQQKQQYQQRLNEQNSYKSKFNWNGPQRNQRIDRNAEAQQQNNGSYLSNWCELCERGFRQPYQLEKHLGEHEKCWFDNCNFEGHSTLLKKHIETQHQSGLFQRIGKVETEEDIEKWREERRKRYPTKANIEARRLVQEERMKRGERIDEPNHRFGNTKTRNRAQQRSFTSDQRDSNSNRTDKKKHDKKRRRTRNKNRNKYDKEGKMDAKSDKPKTTNQNTEVFKKDTVNNSELAVKGVNEATGESVPSSGALAAILGMYGSDSEIECDNVDGSMTENKEKNNSEVSINVVEPEKGPKTCEILNLDGPNGVVVEVPTENTNLKRSSSFSADVSAKVPKVEPDVNEDTKKELANEADDEAPDEQPIDRQTGILESTKDEESGPTGIKPKQRMKPDSKSNVKAPKRTTVLDMTRKIRNQNTMLEKLLQNDIRHERNVLLQCVRYVVENHFFGVGQSANEPINQTTLEEEPK